LALSGPREPELALGELERWAEAGEDELVTRLAKETGRSAGAIRKLLGAALPDATHGRLRAVCDGDEVLLEHVIPFHALLREDLRGDPLVILAGSLYVTQALDRRASGTYYTPRALAEEVVRHTLDPVAYDPGPAQEPDPAKWQLKPARELLELKVCDIAMGSGAFLVAACRYLAARLLEAWEQGAIGEEVGLPHEAPPADPLEREAFACRLVAERCLYGVDKNPIAVEMAKLSLWLITLAKDRPFSFVDHALRCGDSLLGITELRQLRVAHLDPSWHRQGSLDLPLGQIEGAVLRAGQLRQLLETTVVRDIADAKRKAELLGQAEDATRDAGLLGDLIVGAALASVDDADPLAYPEVAGWWRALADPDVSSDRAAVARTELRALVDQWLVERRRAFGEVLEVVWGDRQPFHWALEFGEVNAQGGFDAVVGNPPFQGGKKISGALGGQYRDFLVRWLAGGVRGNADLVAYFYLRAAQLTRSSGGFGLVATNTIAQGDTREVGLDQLCDGGWVVPRAISSEPWPGGANLEVAIVWARSGNWQGVSELDRAEVTGITSALSTRSRVDGVAHRLYANRDLSFQGSNVLGMGFVLSQDEARAMLAADRRNADVVRPYLVGEDLNSRPDGAPSRWVIDFRDWSEERAAEYEAPFARVEQLVRPERATKNLEKYRRNWWQYAATVRGLYRTIEALNRCIVLAQVSKTVQPMLVSTGIVYSHKTVVFGYEDDVHFGLLSSGFHWWWSVTRTSTMRTDISYSPTDCFQTLARPRLSDAVGLFGGELNAHRGGVMLARQIGLTKTYNRYHDPDDHSDDITRLREIHVALDHAVSDAYDWSDLDLGHDFYETKFGTRFTFAPGPRQEVLDRLLELNHERYDEEVRQGLHAKPKAKESSAKRSQALSLLDG
jgi:hypothetical protein